eukprot:TRINITY_DN10312_c0_g1_i1.p1 TRINITY_DN10312_c0_g1~~TRINITY_DN10312_c0_g1_i1.p1  ORF type:complete len:293 (+),score=98.49 TRINITY_DN10312_c0_g1_i1:251-1129(+)
MRPRRSLSQPPPVVEQHATAEADQFRLDPRYAEWYYSQIVRPARHPPPLATRLSADRVDAARHRRAPGTCEPLRLEPADSDGGWGHGRASPREQLRPAPLGAVRPGPVTPQLSPEATPGPSRTTAAGSLQTSPVAPRGSGGAAGECPQRWKETRHWLMSLTHKAKLTGIALLPNKPVQGDTRDSSAQFQQALLQAMADALHLPYEHVEGVRLRWDKQRRCQADDAVVGFATDDALRSAVGCGTFEWRGAAMQLTFEDGSACSEPAGLTDSDGWTVSKQSSFGGSVNTVPRHH